jgi:hypothetical protein
LNPVPVYLGIIGSSFAQQKDHMRSGALQEKIAELRKREVGEPIYSRTPPSKHPRELPDRRLPLTASNKPKKKGQFLSSPMHRPDAQPSAASLSLNTIHVDD